MDTYRNKTPRAVSYYEAEQLCELAFLESGPFFHLCTSGERTENLFDYDDDFRFAMNLMAFCTVTTEDVSVLTFEIMKNHLHVVMKGAQGHLMSHFSLYKKRLYRYFQDKGIVKDLSGFEAALFPIENLDALRNTLVYVNRNGYLADARYTPQSYPWGANRFFFNPDVPFLQGKRYGDLTFREKRQLFRSHSIDYPSEHLILDGYVNPASYCDLKLAEQMFQSARSYFFLLSRNVEAYRNIARQLGDSDHYSDDELFLIVKQICKDKYNNSRPTTLPKDDKIEIARQLRFEYNAGKSQIRRMLRLNESDIAELFGG